MGILNKVHIIHNSDRLDRYKVLMLELEKQGIKEYELFPSVYDSIAPYYGINKAHKNVIQYAKDNGLESIIVAEDDVKFFGLGAFDYWVANRPKDFDVWLAGIYLGEISNGITERFTGLTLYECHSRFYDTFLSLDEYEHIDIAMAYKGLFKVCEPFIVRQHNGFSDNEKRHMNYDFIFDNRPIYSAN